ncbi:DUF6783 domain-containing protein [Candidatus Ventrimonas sp. KK005]
MPRACLKIHSRHLHAPLCDLFGSHSVNVAHYAYHMIYFRKNNLK